MVSVKQLTANRKNALISMGPKSKEGKLTVASNAIKHGIFTKDLFVPSNTGMENEDEYKELLNNLVISLTPSNQIESLLVEKIAIDFWRLRRVIRFEAGSLSKSLEGIFKEFYSYGRKRNHDLDHEIQMKKEYIDWIEKYLHCLRNNEVVFDQPMWQGNTVESELIEDLRLIIKHLGSLSYEEREKLMYSCNDFTLLRQVVSQHGFISNKDISKRLIELYEKEIQKLIEAVENLKQKQLENNQQDQLNTLLGLIPQEENTDKILKYERSIQKSIFQNLFLLRNLQGIL